MCTCTNDCQAQRDKSRHTVLTYLILTLHCTEKRRISGFLISLIVVLDFPLDEDISNTCPMQFFVVLFLTLFYSRVMSLGVFKCSCCVDDNIQGFYFLVLEFCHTPCKPT